jgi:hypothetical protein
MTAQLAEPTQITTPGVYNLPLDVYLADPVPAGSLSSSGARKLLPPNCPARYRYEREHPPTPKPEYDLGHAAHLHALGAGPDLVVVDAADWRTKAAREARADAHTAGKVPLLAAEHDEVVAMAAALRAHPVASRLLHRDAGWPEQSLFWVDKPTGVWRRARLDWLPKPSPARLIIPEYKTCRSAEPGRLQRAIHEYGYHQQAAWYLAGVQALGLAEQAAFAFVFIFQEKDPPFLVTVAELDAVALRIGSWLNRQALNLYRECVHTGRWPGYSDDVESIPLPPYIENRYAEEIFG